MNDPLQPAKWGEQVLPIYPAAVADAARSAGHWANRTYADLIDRWAQFDPSRAALTDGRSSYTYGELKGVSETIAGNLWARGVRPGTRVGLYVSNAAESVLLRLGLNRVGGIVTQLHRSMTSREVAYALQKTATRWILAPVSAQEVLADLRASGCLDVVFTYGGPASKGTQAFEVLLADGGAPVEDWAHARPGPDDIFNIGSTSGTEGNPKFFADSPQKWICGATNLMNGSLCGPETVVMDMPPVTGGLGYFTTFMPYVVGGQLVMLETFTPARALEVIERYAVTYVVALPTQLIKMMHDPVFETTDFSRLRVILNAGGPLSPASAQEIEERFGASVVQTCGTVEAGPTLMSVPGDPRERRWGTVGRLSPGATMRIVDESGADVADGDIGEAWWSGAMVSAGYIDDTPLFDADGWTHSGDLYIRDDDGFLRLVGRKKDMIIRGGQNISAQEVEDALMGHPAIQMAAVVGMPDPVFGERACAFVVTMPGKTMDLATVQLFLGERQLSKYKWPERIEVVAELPHGPGGKVKKAQLRALLRGEAS